MHRGGGSVVLQLQRGQGLGAGQVRAWQVRSTHLLQLQQVEAQHLNGLDHLMTGEGGRDKAGKTNRKSERG